MDLILHHPHIQVSHQIFVSPPASFPKQQLRPSYTLPVAMDRESLVYLAKLAEQVSPPCI